MEYFDREFGELQRAYVYRVNMRRQGYRHSWIFRRGRRVVVRCFGRKDI